MQEESSPIEKTHKKGRQIVLFESSIEALSNEKREHKNGYAMKTETIANDQLEGDHGYAMNREIITKDHKVQSETDTRN